MPRSRARNGLGRRRDYQYAQPALSAGPTAARAPTFPISVNIRAKWHALAGCSRSTLHCVVNVCGKIPTAEKVTIVNS